MITSAEPADMVDLLLAELGSAKRVTLRRAKWRRVRLVERKPDGEFRIEKSRGNDE
ncbi:MAG TPA: hypothetical protein VF844_09290 [Ktedonobacteraceae bacterium]